MEQISYREPHPDWTEVIVYWGEVLGPPRYPIKEMLEWVDKTPGGRYHLHGHESTHGFAFRFENPHDATLFRLRWL